MIEERLQGPPNPSILHALEAIREIEGGRPDDDAILLAHLRDQIDLRIRAIPSARTLLKQWAPRLSSSPAVATP